MDILGLRLPYVKRYFQPHRQSFFSLGFKLLRFSCFQEFRFGRDQTSQFNSDTLSKKLSAMEAWGMCLSFVKKYFHLHQWNYFFLGLKLVRFLCFQECRFERDQRSHLWKSIWWGKYNIYSLVLGVFSNILNILKKIFWISNWKQRAGWTNIHLQKFMIMNALMIKLYKILL